MKSNATEVSAYLEEVPPARKTAMEKLRQLCRENLKGYEECIEFGMPSYKRNGSLEVSFASQKQHIAMYVLKKKVLDEFRDELAASSIGKGCIRFARPDQIDFEVVRRLLRRNVEATEAPC